MTKLTFTIEAGNGPAIEKLFEDFVRDNWNEIPTVTFKNGNRSAVIGTIVAICTITQGAAAGVYLLEKADAFKHVSVFVKSVRELLSTGDSTSLQIDEDKPLDLSKCEPVQVLEALTARRDEGETGRHIPSSGSTLTPVSRA